tara:strand:- start:54 stop:446 length:393 start_codon:yes stop_codon:yes gene_type:complete
MNPDIPNTAEYTMWTLKDSEGNVVTFKVRNRTAPPQVEVMDERRRIGNYLLVAARNMWNEYIRQGFVVQNKCVNHDMDKFHKSCRDVENQKGYSSEEHYGMKELIHDIELHEMRLKRTTKKLCKDTYEQI